MAVGTGLALVGLDTIVDTARRNEVRDRLEGSGRTVVALTQRQVAKFVGSALGLRGRDGLPLDVPTAGGVACPGRSDHDGGGPRSETRPCRR